jgi:hypothetical protein
MTDDVDLGKVERVRNFDGFSVIEDGLMEFDVRHHATALAVMRIDAVRGIWDTVVIRLLRGRTDWLETSGSLIAARRFALSKYSIEAGACVPPRHCATAPH